MKIERFNNLCAQRQELPKFIEENNETGISHSTCDLISHEFLVQVPVPSLDSVL